MQSICLSRRQAEFLLAAVILARSTSFVMTKVVLQGMDAFTLLGFRFLAAFLFLLPFGWRRLQSIGLETLRKGMLLGFSFFAILAAELSALKTTSASTASFLENMAIVFVPLLESILRRKLPTAPAMISAAISLCGVALLTLKNGAFYLSAGEMLCLLAALLYAAAIILTDRISKQDDPLALGILQVGFMGLYSILAAFLFETPRLPATASSWGIILALAIICSGFGFTLQALAQRFTTAERAGLFCALGPVGAALCGSIFLQETLGFAGFLGMTLILLGMVFSTLYDHLLKRKEPHDGVQEHPASLNP